MLSGSSISRYVGKRDIMYVNHNSRAFSATILTIIYVLLITFYSFVISLKNENEMALFIINMTSVTRNTAMARIHDIAFESERNKGTKRK